MRLKSFLLLFSFLLIFNNLVFSQNTDYNQLVTPTTGVLVGGVCDKNAQPLAYAGVYVLNVGDSAVITYAITDDEGKFVIDAIPFGKAFLRIEYFGYSTIYTQPFTLSQQNPVYKIQRIKMTQEATTLEGVEIVAQVEMLENNLDKTVFNVESSITTEGATAVEVLEEIPSVDVDMDGNVTLRGSENVTILVDGKPIDSYVIQTPQFFMMGDNRDNSADSRYWGFVTLRNIRAKATVIYFSFDNDDQAFSFGNPFTWWRIPFRIRWSRIGKVIPLIER